MTILMLVTVFKLLYCIPNCKNECCEANANANALVSQLEGKVYFFNELISSFSMNEIFTFNNSTPLQ